MDSYPSWLLSDVLDAMDGIAYAVDTNDRLCAIGKKRWNEFARLNGAGDLDADELLGRPLFELIEGEEVRAFYRNRVAGVLATMEPTYLVTRCDSPGVKRELRLAMSPLLKAGLPAGVLFQALTIDETVRPPIDLFDFEALRGHLASSSVMPLLTLCSICQRVEMPGDQDRSVWAEAEVYYQRGGSTNVRISHGLCPDCADRHYSELESS